MAHVEVWCVVPTLEEAEESTARERDVDNASIEE